MKRRKCFSNRNCIAKLKKTYISCLILHFAYLSLCVYDWRVPKLTSEISKSFYCSESALIFPNDSRGRNVPPTPFTPSPRSGYSFLKKHWEVSLPATFAQVFGRDDVETLPRMRVEEAPWGVVREMRFHSDPSEFSDMSWSPPFLASFRFLI